MSGVGLPGGKHHRRGNHAKQAAYRSSDKGRLARHLRAMNPQRRAYLKIRRAVLRKLHGGF